MLFSKEHAITQNTRFFFFFFLIFKVLNKGKKLTARSDFTCFCSYILDLSCRDVTNIKNLTSASSQSPIEIFAHLQEELVEE